MADIYKNFLPDGHFADIERLFMTNTIPWFYTDRVVSTEKHFMFGHTFMEDGQVVNQRFFEPVRGMLEENLALAEGSQVSVCFATGMAASTSSSASADVTKNTVRFIPSSFALPQVPSSYPKKECRPSGRETATGCAPEADARFLGLRPVPRP